MKEIIKISLAYIMTFALFLGFLPIGNVHAANEDLSYFEVIEIADPYIIKEGMYYEISNKDKLNNLLGDLYFEKVVVQVDNANKEISKSMTREAVHDVHIAILEENGNTVTSHWWGKKVKTYGRINTINTRNLMNAFGTAASDAGILTALTAAGISFIPGFGTAATVAGAVVGLISWADARTWSTASSLITSKIESQKYYLTIDINAWNMDVQVYVS